MTITAIMNAIARMNLEEQDLMLMVANMSFEKAVEVLKEKGDLPVEEETRTEDLPSDDEQIYYDENDAYLEGWATIANAMQESRAIHKVLMKKVKKGRNHTTKAHLRDKAKAGYHCGSKWEGQGHFDKCLKPEIQAKDMLRDLKTTLVDLESLDTDDTTINMNEVNIDLYNMFGSLDNGTSMVYYQHLEEFKFLQGWDISIQNWMENAIGNMPSEAEVYSFMEDMYPTMSMSDMKTIVEDFIGKWRLNILQEADSMWQYCQRSNRVLRESLVVDLRFYYNALDEAANRARTSSTEGIEDVQKSILYYLSKIKDLKSELAEMDKANTKFI